MRVNGTGRQWAFGVEAAADNPDTPDTPDTTVFFSSGRFQTRLSLHDACRLTVSRSVTISTVQLEGQPVLVIKGPGHAQGADAMTLIGHVIVAMQWKQWVEATLAWYRQQQRWVPAETFIQLAARRPRQDLAQRVRQVGAALSLTPDQAEAVSYTTFNLAALVDATNEQILQLELRTHTQFFDNIEARPLSAEQARAVVSFDNRVQVVAAAGSGKTSVMVARAAYAVMRGFVRPDRILLLAFNRAAAVELQERIDRRLAAAGIPSDGIRASTFHAFGLSVIGAATQAKPTLAPWIETGRDMDQLQAIVNDLQAANPQFARQWHIFRLLFAGTANAPEAGQEPEDVQHPTTWFKTADGKLVRSHGERLIADFLFFNHVDYQYERRYDRTDHQAHADEHHSAYHPDFYYPAADLWHEHWAIGSNGHPPKEFAGYEASMQWKRSLHREHRTTLIETTWAGIVFGDGLDEFARTLRSHGIELRWDPERQTDGGGDVSTDDFTRLMRSFLTHVKANGLTRADVEERLRTGWTRFANRRTTRFLELFWPIHDEWNNRLRADNLLDFDDMLVLATDAVASGQYQSPYELVMVDEFQDVSQGRARLIQHLTAQPGGSLLAVGDDWQSINRFAGADVSVMTHFDKWFGDSRTLQLTTTFRCPQSITDVAAGFVQRNPHQFRKTVKSAQQLHGDPVTIIHTTNVALALSAYLDRLSAEVTAQHSSGTVDTADTADTARPTVLVLGRYQFDRTLMPSAAPTNLQVAFRTAHSSKGLEADYVVIPNLVSGPHGFPSDIQDDPLLDLVMATADFYPRAEERRLFYVALTRAKQRVVLITQTGRESPFITELAQDPRVLSITDQGDEVQRCPTCTIGTLVQRTSRYGPFLGCTRYPACTGKVKP